MNELKLALHTLFVQARHVKKSESPEKSVSPRGAIGPMGSFPIVPETLVFGNAELVKARIAESAAYGKGCGGVFSNAAARKNEAR